MRKTSLALAAAFQALAVGLTANAAPHLSPEAGGDPPGSVNNRGDESAASIRIAQAQTAAKLDFNIPKLALSDALAEWSKQSGLQILRRDTDSATEVTTPSVTGRFSPAEALDKMLAPTGLTYKFVNDRTVRIESVHTKTETSSSSRDGKEVSPAPKTGTRNTASEAASDPGITAPQSDNNNLANPDKSTPVVLDELVVTGSHIRGMQYSAAPLTVIDREMIEKRGFSTVEDVVRSLPQNFAKMNAARSVTQPAAGDLPVGSAAQGEATADLRGLGQSATLVLVNGRRTAGSAAFAGSTVNLASIPVAAIERVEVLTDSAAAVYGSDAIAGVINIVLRRDYSGASSTVRYEDGANGGDKRAVDQVFGTNWNGGNVTGSLSWSETQPISSAKTGYVTNDMRYLGGYDARNTLFAQTGNVLGFGSLPPNFAGTENWTAANLTQANFQLARADAVPRDQSSDTKSKAAYLNVTQNFSDRVQGSLGLRYSEDRVQAQGTAPFLFVTASASNPYNKLGMPVSVAYFAGNEAEAGLIPFPYSANKLQNMSANLDLRFDLPVRDWRLDVSGIQSVSKSRSSGYSYANAFTFFSPATGQTVNVFGNGTAQNVTPFLAAFGPSQNASDRKTTLSGLTLLAEGSAADLPAGDLRTAVGAEYRIEKLSFGAADLIASSFLADQSPEQGVAALFAEAHVPLLSKLKATAQARWERYVVDSSDPAIDGKSFDKVSPRLGLIWNATDTLVLRGSWGRSFKAPNLTRLAVVERQGTFPTAQYDPIQNETVPIFVDNVANPQLKPETGKTINVGFDWTPQSVAGLRTSITYNRTEFSNQIVGSPLVLGGITTATLLANPDAFPGLAVRDPTTNRLLRVRYFPLNVSAVEVDAIDFDLQLTHELGRGRLNTSLQGTYVLRHEQQAAPILPSVDIQGTSSADRFVAVASLGWGTERYGVDLFGHYTHRYLNTEVANSLFGPDAQPMPVRSQTTWDLTGHYDFGAGWRTSGGARNVFDQKFPFAQGFAGPYDTRRVDLRGRLLFVELRKDFSF